MPSGSTTSLRALAAADIPLLSTELPALLPGSWTPAALQGLMGSTHRLRVLDSVVDKSSALVGFAEYEQILDEGHLYGIAILHPWQGRGLGRTFLAKLLQEMQHSGCARCLLEVREGNAAARQLYVRAGFQLDGRRKAYYAASEPGGQPETALLYSLTLADRSQS